MDELRSTNDVDIQVNIEFSDEVWEGINIVRIWVAKDGSHRFEAVLPKRMVRRPKHFWQRGPRITFN